MKRFLSCAASVCSVLFLFGCGTSDNPPSSGAGSSSPTFSNVWTEVILGEACQTAQCHGGGAGNLFLNSKAKAYSNLVGVPADGPCTDAGIHAGVACGCGSSGLIRVVPGHPETSLLIAKLRGDPTCGDRMPSMGGVIPQNQMELVTQWIADGAKND